MACVYLHRRLSDNKPFYVGKGAGKRAWVVSGRNNYWTKVFQKHGLVVEILFDNLSDDDAYEVERDCILELRSFGYILANLNAGGKGGLSPSDETRIRMSLKKRGTTPWNKGKPQTKTAGILNPSADKNRYVFENINGTLFEGTRYELCSEYNLSLNEIGKLFLTIPRSKALGWKLKDVSNGNTSQEKSN